MTSRDPLVSLSSVTSRVIPAPIRSKPPVPAAITNPDNYENVVCRQPFRNTSTVAVLDGRRCTGNYSRVHVGARLASPTRSYYSEARPRTMLRQERHARWALIDPSHRSATPSRAGTTWRRASGCGYGRREQSCDEAGAIKPLLVTR